MNIITATKTATGEQIIKKVPSVELARTMADRFRSFGGYADVQLHENTTTVPAAAPAPAPAPAAQQEQTGRIGQGQHIHRLAEGHSVCGASFRRGLGASRPVYVTGEQVTCGSCRKAA